MSCAGGLLSKKGAGKFMSDLIESPLGENKGWSVAGYRTVGTIAGLPLNWQDETTGILPAAVRAYWVESATDEQLKLVALFLRYYIDAPCWNHMQDIPETVGELACLRNDAANHLNSRHEIDFWLRRALDLGLDPL